MRRGDFFFFFSFPIFLGGGGGPAPSETDRPRTRLQSGPMTRRGTGWAAAAKPGAGPATPQSLRALHLKSEQSFGGREGSKERSSLILGSRDSCGTAVDRAVRELRR